MGSSCAVQSLRQAVAAAAAAAMSSDSQQRPSQQNQKVAAGHADAGAQTISSGDGGGGGGSAGAAAAAERTDDSGAANRVGDGAANSRAALNLVRMQRSLVQKLFILLSTVKTQRDCYFFSFLSFAVTLWIFHRVVVSHVPSSSFYLYSFSPRMVHRSCWPLSRPVIARRTKLRHFSLPTRIQTSSVQRCIADAVDTCLRVVCWVRVRIPLHGYSSPFSSLPLAESFACGGRRLGSVFASPTQGAEPADPSQGRLEQQARQGKAVNLLVRIGGGAVPSYVEHAPPTYREPPMLFFTATPLVFSI